MKEPEAFAEEWIAAFNAHDLSRILSHYEDGITLTSPLVVRVTGEASGTVTGKEALRDYFSRGLAARPDLRFSLRRVYAGLSSVTLEYEALDGRIAAEFMEFGDTGGVRRVVAHYAKPEPPAHAGL